MGHWQLDTMIAAALELPEDPSELTLEGLAEVNAQIWAPGGSAALERQAVDELSQMLCAALRAARARLAPAACGCRRYACGVVKAAAHHVAHEVGLVAAHLGMVVRLAPRSELACP